jgi:hypothetical protein
MKKLPLSLCVLLAACAPQPGDEVETTDDSVETPTVAFLPNAVQRSSSPLVATRAMRVMFDPARLPDCRGAQNGTAVWSITGHYRFNGGTARTFPVVQLGTTVPARIEIPADARFVEFWFQNTNRWGCNAWDSAMGRNYRFEINPAPTAPDWIGNGAIVMSRATCPGACDSDRRSIQPWTYDSWVRQRATVRSVFFDVYKRGVTDFNNPNLWRALDVKVHFRYRGQTEFSTRHVRFSRYDGNNARYELDLWQFDVLPDRTLTTCPPAALTRSANGQTADAGFEYYFTVNGVAYRPQGGGVFTGSFVNWSTLVPAQCFAR